MYNIATFSQSQPGPMVIAGPATNADTDCGDITVTDVITVMRPDSVYLYPCYTYWPIYWNLGLKKMVKLVNSLFRHVEYNMTSLYLNNRPFNLFSEFNTLDLFTGL